MHEDDKYELAAGFVLTTTPSQLCRKLIDTLCPDHPNLENCCMAPVVAGMWRAQLPKAVKNAIAGKSLKGGQLATVLELADAVFKANGGKATPQVASLEEGDDGEAGGISAFNKKKQQGKQNKKQNGGNGRGNRGGAASNTGNGQPPPNKGPRHPDNPPKEVCQKHWQFGKETWYCLRTTEPNQCPWHMHITPRK